MRIQHALGIGLVCAMSISLAGLTGCAPQTGKAAASGNQNEIVIGEFGSFTGTTASYGQSTHDGVKMAFDEINKAGGVLGKQIKLISEDDQSKPEEAAMAVSKLISRDKVVAVIGEVASSRTLAAAPIAQREKTPLISPASTNPEVTRKGDYIFRICFIDPFQGSVIAKFAKNTLKANNVVILKDVKNDYSIGLSQFFTKTFTELGGKIVGEQAYSEGDVDFKAQLTAIKAMKPEAIILPGYYTEAALIIKQARELNINVPFIGGDGWDSAKLFEIGGKAINGCYYSNHYSYESKDPLTQDFVKKFTERYKRTPDVMAALGYDDAKIVADAIKRAGSIDKAKIREALAATKDFAGVTGKITIDKDRNANKSAVMLEIKNQVAVYKETIQP